MKPDQADSPLDRDLFLRSPVRKLAGVLEDIVMTSNVFRHMAAENPGYARVEREETSASGHSGCRIAVYPKHAGSDTDGREYFRSESGANP